MGFDGANDAVGCGFNGFGLFDDEFEAATGPGGTEFVEAKRTGVTVEGAAVRELEVVDDDRRSLPVKEGLVDHIAFGVVANGAVGSVMVEAYAPIPCWLGNLI